LLPGLSRQQGLLWQDSGKTTAATTDGHPVRVATCPFTGKDWVAPTNGQRPTLRVSGGVWYLEFTHAALAAMLGPSEADLTGAATISLRAAETVSTGGRRILQSNDINAVYSHRRSDGFAFFIGSLVAAGPFASDSNPHTATWQRGSGNWSLRVDGTSKTVNANSTAWRRVGVGAGGSQTVESFDGRLYGLGLVAASVDDATRALIESYLEGWS
jgi:hypothetical protein